MFAQMFRRFMRLRLIVIELLICFRHGYIQHGAFSLFRLEGQRIECGTVFADFREEADKTVLNDHAAVVVEELNILRERAGRHIDFDLFRLLRRHSWLTPWDKVAFGTFNNRSTFDNGLGLGSLCRLTLQTHLFQLTMGNRHHGFIESIDGRIVLPVE